MKTVLLAAGFGSRLWPLSTSEKPKQFQPLLHDQSLLQYTYTLFRTFTPAEDVYVITLRSLEHWVRQQLPDIKQDHIMTVPERRNTLPHTAFAISCIAKTPSEPIFFSGTDLLVTEPEAFGQAIQKLSEHTDPKKIVMMLSENGAPDTGAGYALLDDNRAVTKFYEKPGLQIIKKLSRTGSFYKNTFAYLISQSALQTALSNADISLIESIHKLLAADDAHRDKALLALPVCDISTAVFQYAQNIVGHIVASDFVDVGKFSALYAVNQKDPQGNVVMGSVLVEEDCTNNLIINTTNDPLVVMATQDSVVVQTRHGSLVAPINQADRVGDIYKQKIHKHPSQQR